MSPHSTRRINFLKSLFDAKSYLEIGVCKGMTFNALKFETKVAVDPRFQFSVPDFISDRVEFHEVTSDAFFRDSSSDRFFDIIFLDGLHTYDQTYRDLTNALLCSHPTTFILIDDTLPNDIYSAMRNPALCNRYRNWNFSGMAKPPGKGSWHGDTYKIVYFIQAFLSKFQYATINTKGNPQTLLWNRSIFQEPTIKNLPFKQFSDQRLLRHILESFHKVDFYWTMNEFFDIFQTCGEDSLFEYLNSSKINKLQQLNREPSAKVAL